MFKDRTVSPLTNFGTGWFLKRLVNEGANAFCFLKTNLDTLFHSKQTSSANNNLPNQDSHPAQQKVSNNQSFTSNSGQTSSSEESKNGANLTTNSTNPNNNSEVYQRLRQQLLARRQLADQESNQHPQKLEQREIEARASF